MAEITQGACDIPQILIHRERHDSIAKLLPICWLHNRTVNYIRSIWKGKWPVGECYMCSGESKPLDRPWSYYRISFTKHNTKFVLATTSLQLEIEGHHALIKICTSQCRGPSFYIIKTLPWRCGQERPDASVIIAFCYWGFNNVQPCSLLLSIGISSTLIIIL